MNDIYIYNLSSVIASNSQVSCVSVYPMSMGLHILDGSGSGRRCLLKGYSKSTFVRRERETVSKRRTITRGGGGVKKTFVFIIT